MLKNKFDLTYVTFLICFSCESVEDLTNFKCILKYLQRYFVAHLIVWELGIKQFSFPEEPLKSNIKYNFFQEELPVTQKAKYLNMMIREVTTPVIAIWEIDEIVPPDQLYTSAEAIRKDNANYSYAFNSCNIFKVNRLLIETLIDNNDPLECIYENELWQQQIISEFVSQSFLIDYQTFKRAGNENENIIAWNMNSQERQKRFEILGLTCYKAKGQLIKIHGDPDNNIDNFLHRKHLQDLQEFLRICKMQKNELEKEVNKWGQRNPI